MNKKYLRFLWLILTSCVRNNISIVRVVALRINLRYLPLFLRPNFYIVFFFNWTDLMAFAIILLIFFCIFIWSCLCFDLISNYSFKPDSVAAKDLAITMSPEFQVRLKENDGDSSIFCLCRWIPSDSLCWSLIIYWLRIPIDLVVKYEAWR